MVTNKLRNLIKSRKLYLLLCCVILCGLFVETRVANTAPVPPPKGIAVEIFTEIEFGNNPQCWTVTIPSTGIEYTNSCGGAAAVDVVLTHLDGTKATFLIAPGGRLIFLNGSGNIVHIIKEQIE